MQQLQRAAGLLNIDEIQKKVILVAGVGSVNSLFLLNFPYAIGKILLADPEILGPENVERHWLGTEWLGQPKVDGVKDYLVSKGVPAGRIVTHQGYAQDLMDHKIDLLVVGIDKTSVRKEMANFAYGRMPVIYGGVFPMGTGGRVFVTNKDGPCFHCAWNTYGGEYTGKGEVNYGIDPTTLIDDEGELQAVPALMASVSPVSAQMARFAKLLLTGNKVTPQVWNIIYDEWETMMTLPLSKQIGDIARFIGRQKRLGMVSSQRLSTTDGGKLNWQIRNAIMSFDLKEWNLCPLKSSPVSFDNL